ncbi:TM1812 family CRISPR-associated protein [Thermatribacter velox]|uniref:TM1812 family CRISPR-associated protein n=1 Tax=Thermatribacter velox TaxID=3039681 RepID=A0ABZ2YCP5_9BACT
MEFFSVSWTGCLRELSKALHLSRPLDVMHYAHRLLPLLDEALKEIQHWSPPFAVVVQPLREEVQSLAYHHPEDLDTKNLHHQLELIRYCLRRRLIVQAVTLAREWLVSWVILQRGEGVPGFPENNAKGQKKL